MGSSIVTREGDRISDDRMMLLKRAVDVIVEREQKRNRLGESDDFWAQFREILLAEVAERYKEILP